jgi:hypothetical protein
LAGAGTGLVARELAKRGVKEAAEKILKERGEDAAKVYFEKAAKDVALDIGKKRGQTAALAGQAAFYGTGQTTSRAVEEAEKLGGTATDIELARVLPAAAVSTVAEFIGDKIALGALKGIKPGEPGKFVTTDLAKNILLNIGLTGTKEVPVEVIQSAAERFGAKLSLTDAQALKEYIDATASSYGMAVAPGVGGGVRQTMAERAKPTPEVPPATPPAPPPPALEYKPEPFIQFPDGTVAKRSEVEAYIKTLPEDQQMAMRAKLLGLAPQEAEAPPTEPTKALEYKPEPLIVYPDGSVARSSEVETYIQSLPEDEQVAARAKLLGMGEEATRVTPEMLRKLGIRGRAPVIQRLSGLELTDPKVTEELTNFAAQPYASPEVRGNIFGFLNTIKPVEPAAEAPVAPVAEAPVEPAAPAAPPVAPAPVVEAAAPVVEEKPAREPSTRKEAEAFGKAIGAAQPYPGELRGRVNLPAQKAAKEGNFQGVLSALEKSKNVIVAEIAKRAKSLGTKIVIDDNAEETYTGRSELMRQMSIDGAKMHLEALNKIRALAPKIDALPDGFRLGYDITGEKINAIDGGKDVGRMSLEDIADVGHSMFAPLATGPFKLKTKEDFKRLQKAYEDLTSEYGENALQLTSTGSAEMRGVAGVYDADTDTIRVPEYFAKREEVLSHEIVHAQTVQSIANPTLRQKPIVARLNKLYEHVKKELESRPGRAPYGIQSIQEFVAEGMGNPAFQFLLKKIKYENTSAWDSFVQTIANLIGVKRDTAFTELLSIYSDLTTEQKAPAAPTVEAAAPKAEAPPTLDTSDIKEVKGRHPQVQAAAKLLQEKKMSREEFEKYVDAYKPIETIKAETLYPPSSVESMAKAIRGTENKKKINIPIADGIRVGLRMDLPARDQGVPVVSIHEGKPNDDPKTGKPYKSSGKVIGYGSTGYIKDVFFAPRDQEKSLVMGIEPVKNPLQTAEGTWVNLSPEETYTRVKELMKDPAWKQVGFDPARHGYFYDRKTREPVVSASEMYQVGQFLLAKDVKYAPKSDFLYSLGGERAQVQAFEQTLRSLLNKFGLKDVGLKILDGMTDSGSYAAQLIRIAADAANPVRTLRHEAIHALRELGFFTDAQWSSLSKMAKDKWIDQYLKQRNVDGKPLKAGEESRYDAYMREYNGDMEKITEEAVSDAFADFDATKPPAGMLQALLKRMKDLFQSIKSALTKVESPEQIFGKVEKGELNEGARKAKGEAKSLRDRATANFRRWFGDSKVVDEKGEPLVVYHGTGADIDAFRGRGRFYFAEKPEYAASFAGKYFDEYKRPNIMPVYLSVQKPLDLTALGGDFVSTNDLVAALEKAGAIKTAQAVKDRQFEKYGRKQGVNVWELWHESPIREAVKDDGFDGVIQIEQAAKDESSMHESRVVMVFNPTQIKSAIGNNGDYSLTNADIRKSIGGIKAAAQKALQKQPMPEKGLGHVKQDLKNLAQPIFFAQNKTILDRIDGMKDRFWQRVAQNTADQFRTIKEYSPLGYMQARLSKSVDGGLEGLLFHGQVFDDGGALNIKAKTKGMMDILKPLGNELDSYLMWVALNRESNLPEEKRSKIANMDQLVARRDEFSAGELNGKPRAEVYRDVLRQMNQLNKSVLDIALAKGLINQEAYDKFSSDIYYIPFYKKMEEDGDISGAQTASGLTSQYFSKELKGGDKPFGDLMENVVRNWSHILSASMKNAAAKTTLDDAVELGAAVPNLKVGLEWKDGKVYSIKSGKPIEAKVDEDGKVLYEAGVLRPDLTKQDAGMAKVMVDGQPMYFKVTDDLLMDSISSIGYLGPKSKFILLMRDFKNMLQYGVTASPIFKTNNLIRDSVAAMSVSDLKKNPFANVIEGISLSKKDSPTYISALAGGAIFNFGSAYEGDQAKLIKRLIDQGVPGNSILDTKEKITKGLKNAWDAYQHLGDRSEAANRLSLYQQMRDKGMNHLQASFMARDLLDFSMQGSWPAFRLLTQVVPFMNARIQGLYKLGRDGIIPTTRVLYNATTGKEIDANDKIRAAQFATITTAVMLASALLYLSFKDDEDFKKRDAWDRDNFWWIKLPGMDMALRVPKPFEVGAFGTLVERTLEQILDQGAEGKQFGESLGRTLWDTFSLNPTPQMFKPLIDIYANKDSFSGAPIESAGLERLSKQERATDQTSPLAIALGGVTSLFPEKFQLSPVQMDYMLKGYFGWLGAMASVTSTYAVMPFKEGEYPDARWLDRASLGLARELPAPQSAYVTQFYNASKEISQAYADMRHYREMGDAEKVQEILEEKGDQIALAKFYDKTAKNIANVRKQIRLITNDKDMDGAEKKEAIERMKLIMSDLAKQAEEVRKSMKQ